MGFASDFFQCFFLLIFAYVLQPSHPPSHLPVYFLNILPMLCAFDFFKVDMLKYVGTVSSSLEVMKKKNLQIPYKLPPWCQIVRNTLKIAFVNNWPE